MTAERVYTDYLLDILDAIAKTEQFWLRSGVPSRTLAFGRAPGSPQRATGAPAARGVPLISRPVRRHEW